MNARKQWFGPISGVVAVALVILGQGSSGSADIEPSDSVGTIMAELRGSADGIVFTMLGAGLLLVYVGHLRARFHEHGVEWAGSVFSAGGAVLVGALLIFAGAQLAGAEAADQGHTEVARGVVDFTWNAAWLFSPGLLALGIGAAAASFPRRVVPVWLGVFGVLVALSAIAPWVGVPLFALWVLAASIDELVRAIREPSTTEALQTEVGSRT